MLNALKQPILTIKSANHAQITAKNAMVREDVPNVMNPTYLRTVNANHVLKEAIMKLESAFPAVKTVKNAKTLRFVLFVKNRRCLTVQGVVKNVGKEHILMGSNVLTVN